MARTTARGGGTAAASRSRRQTMVNQAQSSTDLSDEQLMTAYARGDANAFETLYQRHRGPLYRYLYRQVSDVTLANDLYQGCWEKVIKGKKKYRKGAPFRPWLFRIAHNHLVDHFRAHRPADELDESRTLHPADGPEESMQRDQQHRGFLGELARLPEVQRNALLLHFETGLGVAEIGVVTGVSAETVKSRLRYATRKLKETLGP